MTNSMDKMPSNRVQHFFCFTDDKTQGPYDLIELAAQLRCATIDSDTPVRREGEEQWQALRELPEFDSLHEISIETMARHLEEKERPQLSLLSRAGMGSWLTGVTPVAISILVAAALVVIVMLFQQSSPPAAPLIAQSPTPVLWTRMVGKFFFVDCPVPMNREDTTPTYRDKDTISYRATSGGTDFTVDVYHVPASVPASEYDFMINLMRDRVMKKHGRILNQRSITVDGYRGLDAYFNDDEDGPKVEGGVRVLGGSGKLAVASIVAKVGILKQDEINHFLRSFEIQ